MPMTRKQKADLLQRVELFSNLTARARGLIADRMVDATFAVGQHIVRQGQVGTGFYVIVEGRVKVVRGAEILARLGPHEFFGELSVLDQEPRMAHVVAEDATTCLGLASWDFTKLLEDNPKITLSMLRVLARRLRGASSQPHH
jgi:CRP-like cAMP-binding protein